MCTRDVRKTRSSNGRHKIKTTHVSKLVKIRQIYSVRFLSNFSSIFEIPFIFAHDKCHRFHVSSEILAFSISVFSCVFFYFSLSNCLENDTRIILNMKNLRTSEKIQHYFILSSFSMTKVWFDLFLFLSTLTVKFFVFSSSRRFYFAKFTKLW